MRTIIIPAGGKATRFGGTLKELLPINATDTPLLRALQNAVIGFDADEVLVISSLDKIKEHAYYVGRNMAHAAPFIRYSITTSDNLWEALDDVMPLHDGGIVLADTVTFVEPQQITAPLVFGVFKTFQPERFSVIRNDTIITKQPMLNAGHSLAWGVVLWSKEVVDYWRKHQYETYDDAFRDAMRVFGYATFDLPYYYDLGSFEAYVEFLKENHG